MVRGRATHIHVDVFVNGPLVKNDPGRVSEHDGRRLFNRGVCLKGQNSTSNSSDKRVFGRHSIGDGDNDGQRLERLYRQSHHWDRGLVGNLRSD